MADSDSQVQSDERFAVLYRSEHVRQVRSATLLLGSQTAAHDVVHDAFAAVWERWNDLDDPGPYLQRAVVNRCRDIRRRSQTADRLARRSAPPQDVPEADLDLYQALARLPFKHRAAVVLRFYGQLTEAEIADRLECRPGSVGPWIRRGLDKLAAELTESKEIADADR